MHVGLPQRSAAGGPSDAITLGCQQQQSGRRQCGGAQVLVRGKRCHREIYVYVHGFGCADRLGKRRQRTCRQAEGCGCGCRVKRACGNMSQEKFHTCTSAGGGVWLGKQAALHSPTGPVSMPSGRCRTSQHNTAWEMRRRRGCAGGQERRRGRLPLRSRGLPLGRLSLPGGSSAAACQPVLL